MKRTEELKEATVKVLAFLQTCADQGGGTQHTGWADVSRAYLSLDLAELVVRKALKILVEESKIVEVKRGDYFYDLEGKQHDYTSGVYAVSSHAEKCQAARQQVLHARREFVMRAERLALLAKAAELPGKMVHAGCFQLNLDELEALLQRLEPTLTIDGTPSA